jgi:glycosyltransferase involved in cell wall biosynthesis
MEAMRMGGAETVVLEHVRHADPSYDVAVCSLNGWGEALEQARDRGARVFDLGDRRAVPFMRPVLRLIRLARLMRRERIDVVNAHNPTGALYGVLAARLAGVPVIVRTEHSVHDATRHSRVYLMLEPLLTAWSRQVVCVSEVVRESHRRRLPRYGDRFVTVRNGISDAAPRRSRSEVRASLTLQDDAPVLLTVGSLTPHKAQHVLLEAFAALSRRRNRARLLVAGDGPLRGALEERAARLGLRGSVQFLGARDDIPELLAAADALALSSTREGLPISILEAMRAGRAVVATDAGGVREVVADGATGFVVPTEDPWTLASALEALVSDPEKTRAMGAEAHERWEREFAGERMVRETEQVYGVTHALEGSLALD